MPKQTIQAALIEGLLALGYTQTTRKWSTKYKCFVHSTSPAIGPKGRPIYLFVGPNGALRRGTAVSNSFSCSDAFRLKILEAGPAKRATLQAQQSQAFANL